MNPTMSDLHTNAVLTNLSLMYAQSADAFVAQKVFPIVPVQHRSDYYTIFSRADMNRDTMRKRAPGTETVGTGWKTDKATYSADVWGLHQDIDDQTRANADAVFNLDRNATQMLTNQALISRERDWATTFFTTGVWTTTRTGIASGSPTSSQFIRWDDYVNSAPIVDIRNAKQAGQLVSGGYRFNKLVLGRQVFDKLCDHPDFIERIKYGGTNDSPAIVARRAMAQLFELDDVLIMDAVYNSGPEMDAAAGINAGENNVFIGGKLALLVYTPVTPGLEVPASGYTFAWTGYFGAAANGVRMKSFYMENIASTRIEIEAAYDHKAVGLDMGVFFNTVIS